MITLVLGGARSGKSAVAERLIAAAPPPVVYVATGRPVDPDMTSRIAVHQARRPASWSTVEACDDLAGHLDGVRGSVLVDALGTWVAGHPDFAVDTEALCRVLANRPGDTVLVSEEVGMGVHPSTEVGRAFRDALGEVNQAVAEVADRVLLVVAGRVLPLERP